jgi:2-oxoglutarate ferredoxin oxidoreductase subunit alpha
VKYLNPFPPNIEQVLRSYGKVAVPELNLGQLRALIRARYLIDVIGINEVKGKMFLVESLVTRAKEILAS